MSRRHNRAAPRLALAPPPPAQTQPAPAETILDQIAAGELDAHLTPIAEAIRARHDLLQALSSAKALAQLKLGDRVRINHHATARYLHGVHGTIVHLDDHDAELDSLITEITVDCYDEDEGLTGFENAFDEETTFPIPATLIGQPIEILAIGTHNGRRELIATCQHAGQQHHVALLDTTIHPNHPAGRLLNAYRYWLAA